MRKRKKISFITCSLVCLVIFSLHVSAKEKYVEDGSAVETTMYDDLSDINLKNEVDRIVTQVGCDNEVFALGEWRRYDAEALKQIEILGEKSIPYLLQFVIDSESNGDRERFIVQCINDILDLDIMIGSWESGYRVECEYDMYSPKWYAYQLMSWLNEDDCDIMEMKEKHKSDIYDEYTDVEMENKVLKVISEIDVNYNPVLSSPPRISENQESYEKFEMLGKEAIPYMLEYIEKRDTIGLDEAIKEQFVSVCVSEMYDKFYGWEEHQLKCKEVENIIGGIGKAHMIMSFIKDSE